MNIPTQKGEHLFKCTELSLKWKDGNIMINTEVKWFDTYSTLFEYGHPLRVVNDFHTIVD